MRLSFWRLIFRVSRLEVQGSRFEVRGRRFEVRGSQDRDPRSEVRGSRSEARGPRSEVRGPRFEVQGPRSKVRDSRLEVRDPRSEVGTRGFSKPIHALRSASLSDEKFYRLCFVIAVTVAARLKRTEVHELCFVFNALMAFMSIVAFRRTCDNAQWCIKCIQSTRIRLLMPSGQMVRLKYGRIQPGFTVRQTIQQMKRESVLRSETRQGQICFALVVGFCCWFVVFLFLPVCFCGLFCVFGFLAGTAYWTAYRSTTSTFVAN